MHVNMNIRRVSIGIYMRTEIHLRLRYTKVRKILRIILIESSGYCQWNDRDCDNLRTCDGSGVRWTLNYTL